MEKIKVAILGATGIVGQVFCRLLSDHEWFEPVVLAASASKDGAIYRDVTKWSFPSPMPDRLSRRTIDAPDPALLNKKGIKIVFSALPAGIAVEVEPDLRRKGFFVFSNAGAMRDREDVPVLVPEVNIESLALIERQGYPEGGFVVANPNCTTAGLALALAPLRRFGIREIFLSTYQAVSGAGYPGLPYLDISNNCLPYIENEEEKIERELVKILGIDCRVFPYCVRVPVPYGHLETVWVKFEGKTGKGEVLKAWNDFSGIDRQLPMSPDRPVVYLDEKAMPQPSISFHGDPPGMQVYTGRLKVEGDRAGFVLVVNNLVRGAAGGSIHNAESFVNRYGGLS